MDIGEIIGDAFVYPFHNIKALILFILIGIIGFVLGGTAIIGMVYSITVNQSLAGGGLGVLGILIFLIAAFLITGYTLDIVKFGIERRDDAPGIDFSRQVMNALKLIVVGIVYYIVPTIIIWLLLFLLGHGILTIIITIIVGILFAFAEFMAKCKLAKTDSLSEALAITTAINEIAEIGMIKILAIIIFVFFIGILLVLFGAYIMEVNATVGGIILGIVSVYLVFFYNRAIGLLYSQV